jgi:hypothetical protein
MPPTIPIKVKRMTRSGFRALAAMIRDVRGTVSAYDDVSAYRRVGVSA